MVGIVGQAGVMSMTATTVRECLAGNREIRMIDGMNRKPMPMCLHNSPTRQAAWTGNEQPEPAAAWRRNRQYVNQSSPSLYLSSNLRRQPPSRDVEGASTRPPSSAYAATNSCVRPQKPHGTCQMPARSTYIHSTYYQHACVDSSPQLHSLTSFHE